MDANILGASIIGIAPKNVIKNIWQVSKKASNLHIQGRNQRDKAVVAAYLFIGKIIKWIIIIFIVIFVLVAIFAE